RNEYFTDRKLCTIMSAMNRIKQWREHVGLSQARLAEAIGTSRSQIVKLERGERRLTQEWMERLSRVIGCAPADFLPVGPGVRDAQRSLAPGAVPMKAVPVLSFVQAGHWCETPVDPAAIEMAWVPEDVGRNVFGLRVLGESMSPDFSEGDLIFVDPDMPPRPGCYVVAKRDSDNESTFKKYRPRIEGPDGYIELAPLNDDYPMLRLDTNHPGCIIGPVIYHQRRLI
ncbi:MAG: XRE family transcriptional regulator, partial [Pseudomonadota bacterium]|nr:XRE family transcriptional regulator [Pseudomonadota bacterium]